MSKKDDAHRGGNGQQREDPSHKFCIRFHNETIQRDYKDAVTYLQLRNSGCARKEAIMFAAKKICRFDTTKEKDGPPGFRFLKLQQVPTHLKESGWVYEQPDYQFGKFFPSRFSESAADKEKQEKMEENFNEQEMKVRKEYKEMINRMKSYVTNINEKYSFPTENQDQFLEVVKKAVTNMKNQLESRCYLMLNNVHFYEVADSILQKNNMTEEERDNLIEHLNVFNNYEQANEFQNLPIFKENEEEEEGPAQLKADRNLQSIQSFHQQSVLSQPNISIQQLQSQQGIPQMQLPHFHQLQSQTSVIISPNVQINPLPTPSFRQKPTQLNKKGMQTIEESIKYAKQLKNLEAATKLLEEFEKSETEDANEPMNRFDRTYEQEKKNRQEEMKSILAIVRQDDQGGLEGQFNQQKYFFANDFKVKSDLPKEQNQKKELQNYIVNTYCKSIDDKYFQEKEEAGIENKSNQSTNQIEALFSSRQKLIDSFLIKIATLPRRNRKSSNTYSNKSLVSSSQSFFNFRSNSPSNSKLPSPAKDISNLSSKLPTQATPSSSSRFINSRKSIKNETTLFPFKKQGFSTSKGTSNGMKKQISSVTFDTNINYPSKISSSMMQQDKKSLLQTTLQTPSSLIIPSTCTGFTEKQIGNTKSQNNFNQIQKPISIGLIDGQNQNKSQTMNSTQPTSNNNRNVKWLSQPSLERDNQSNKQESIPNQEYKQKKFINSNEQTNWRQSEKRKPPIIMCSPVTSIEQKESQDTMKEKKTISNPYSFLKNNEPREIQTAQTSSPLNQRQDGKKSTLSSRIVNGSYKSSYQGSPSHYIAQNYFKSGYNTNTSNSAKNFQVSSMFAETMSNRINSIQGEISAKSTKANNSVGLSRM